VRDDRGCPRDLSVLGERERMYAILRWSALPGASRHHWGTDIDLCNLENNFFLTKSGKRIYEWLLKNAYLYGFCQTYTSLKEGERTGYNEEKWHWSYQPTSRVFTENASKILQDIDFQDLNREKTIVVASKDDEMMDYQPDQIIYGSDGSQRFRIYLPKE